MAAKQVKVNETLMHTHFHYSLKFNNISLLKNTATCNLFQQRKVLAHQKELMETPRTYFIKLINERVYLAFSDKVACITVDTVASKRASDATARREFHCNNLPLKEMLSSPLPLTATYVTEKSVLELFHPSVISANTVDSNFSEISDHLNTIVFESLGSLLSGNEAGHVGREISDQLKILGDDIKEKHMQLMTNARKLDNELPYSNWLQKHLKIALDPFGFVVDTQAKEIKPIAPVNEYTSSQPDLLIYHSENFAKTFRSVYVEPVYPHIDILCTSSTKQTLNEVDVSGFTAELKVDKLHDKAENECFYNMFGQSTNLAMMAITSGKVVTKLSMYGIVVAVEKPNEARLLQLVMDFEENQCRFMRSHQHHNFTMLLNLVLEELSKDT